jgi:hypothetical protein
MKTLTTLVLAVAFATASFATIPVAQAAKNLGCAEVARKGANNKARERVFKTVLMGGTTALVIGAILSNNNKKGEVRAGGAFGGGLIAGTAAKVQWKRDYAVALRQCRKGH